MMTKFKHASELEKSAKSAKPTTKRLLAFTWPDCPTAALAKGQRSNDWLERAAIARHPKTPDSTLNNLVEDVHPVVRVLAKTNMEARQS